jgi:transposase
MKISALTVQKVLEDLKEQTETFSSVAKRYHISPTSAASIFDQHVRMPRLTLPEYQCWDEAYAFHHQGENSKYVFTILDFQSQEAVDILPSRKKQYLISYFMNIPVEERKRVKMISTDMYSEYRAVIHEVFSDSVIHSCDHYHVSQELSRKVDRVRIRVMKSVPKYKEKGSNIQTDEYYLCKKFNWLIFKREDTRLKDKLLIFDPNRERKMNHKLQRMLNYYDIRTMIEAIHPDLKAAWRLKDDLVDFYDNNTYETAPEALNNLIRKFRESNVPEMIEFARTLRNWYQEIINSFITVKYGYRVDKDTGQVVVSAKKINNGIMECKNGVLKQIKGNANGYSNWERFRNRCLYVLRPDARALLNPIDDTRKKKK